MNDKTKVLYIMGTGRSGSTILEILLGNGGHAFGAGELSLIVEDGFLENKPCSCGASFRECSLWSKVIDHLSLSDEEIRRWAVLMRKVDWHTGLLKRLFKRFSKREMNEYSSFNLRLFEAIRKLTGARVIVDSSKYAARAWALSECEGIDVFTICLTRSPEGLMNSFQKMNKGEQPPKTPWGVVRYYLFVMVSISLVSTKLRGKIFNLTYENFLLSPVTTLAEISKKGKIDLTDVIERIKSDGEYSIGHLITANRLRKNSTIKFERTLNNSISQFGNVRFQIAVMHLIKRFFGDKLND